MKKGISASKGYAIGNVVLQEHNEIIIIEKSISNVNLEKTRLQSAIIESKKQLILIKNKAELEIGTSAADVFESHIMLLDDPDFIMSVEKNIELNLINAEKALSNTTKSFLNIFESIEDLYLRERAVDIKDVSTRILCNLIGKKPYELPVSFNNTVIVSHDLTPSDTAQLDKNKTVAFLTDIGGSTSHTAIMARTLEIPTIVGLIDISTSVKNGDLVIVDGVEGLVIINPDNITIEKYKQKKESFEKEKEELKRFLNVDTFTKNGKRIWVVGNIGNTEDLVKVIENGGEGVGLFRTEFLYMNRTSMPTEDEQFEAYKLVAEKLHGKHLVIRTLDIGGDKKLSYLPMPEELNPSLGYRAIRFCLDRTDIFKIQLRALLRASAFGNLNIIFPMISSVEEFLQAKEIMKECAKELTKENIAFNEHIPTGIMIEVPAAAIIADEFAKHVDFFSIGTNDLIQYTLAADRINEKVSYIYNHLHPAVLKLIKMTIDAAHANGKSCSMCGEMAGDETTTKMLVEYGLDEFSMSASSILKIKKLIMNI